MHNSISCRQIFPDTVFQVGIVTRIGAYYSTMKYANKAVHNRRVSFL